MAKQPDLWASHFRAALTSKGKLPPGPGWLTRVEFQLKAGIGRTKASAYIHAETKAKRLDIFHGSMAVEGRKVPLPQVWYRPVNFS